MVGDRLGVSAKKIGIDVEGSRHLRRGIECELSLAALEIDITCEDRLAVLDNIDIRGAAIPCRKHFELNGLAGLDDRTVGAQQNLVSARARLERNTAGDTVTAVVVG